jgi:hypothetical protein
MRSTCLWSLDRELQEIKAQALCSGDSMVLIVVVADRGISKADICPAIAELVTT